MIADRTWARSGVVLAALLSLLLAACSDMVERPRYETSEFSIVAPRGWNEIDTSSTAAAAADIEMGQVVGAAKDDDVKPKGWVHLILGIPEIDAAFGLPWPDLDTYIAMLFVIAEYHSGTLEEYEAKQEKWFLNSDWFDYSEVRLADRESSMKTVDGQRVRKRYMAISVSDPNKAGIFWTRYYLSARGRGVTLSCLWHSPWAINDAAEELQDSYSLSEESVMKAESMAAGVHATCDSVVRSFRMGAK